MDITKPQTDDQKIKVIKDILSAKVLLSVCLSAAASCAESIMSDCKKVRPKGYKPELFKSIKEFCRNSQTTVNDFLKGGAGDMKIKVLDNLAAETFITILTRVTATPEDDIDGILDTFIDMCEVSTNAAMGEFKNLFDYLLYKGWVDGGGYLKKDDWAVHRGFLHGDHAIYIQHGNQERAFLKMPNIVVGVSLLKVLGAI